MRVAISGAAGVGKSTLIQAFKRRWPMYESPSKTYRDVIVEQGLQHSSKATAETQSAILNWMMTEQKARPPKSKVIYDRCSLDNLVYTLQGNLLGNINDVTTAATISLVRESMKDLDMIFWIKYNPAIPLVDDGMRDANLEYVIETDRIFNDLFQHYMDNIDDDVFFPATDCPAIIAMDETFLTVDDRLMFIGEFLDINGNLIETDSSVLSLENLEIFGNILKDQEKQQEADDRINKIISEFKK